MICPKCQFESNESKTDSLPGVCPACGIAFSKWDEIQAQEKAKEDYLASLTVEEHKEYIMTGMTPAQLDKQAETWQQAFFYYVCFMPSDRHESAFWGHTLLYVCFLVWGFSFIFHGVDWSYIGSSFLHNINLPFHEYGHVMFSPFGDFWMLLGGSLFQIILPLFPFFVFMVKQRDNFAASLCLWWCGQNFIDVSPYIADAPTRFLPLTSRHADAHDWWNLLNMTNTMDNATFYANLSFMLGVAIILLSNVWGGFLLLVELKGRLDPNFGKEE